MLKFLKSFVKVKAKCGHKTRLYDKITVIGKDGKTEKIGMESTSLKPIYCHDCFQKMAIRCAWCGEYILPNEPITLHKPKKDFEIPEYAVVYKENPKLLVGCLSYGCANTGADRAGFWIVPGKVQLTQSIFQQAFDSPGEVFVISDIRDINEATLIPD